MPLDNTCQWMRYSQNNPGTDYIDPEILHPYLLQLCGSHNSKFTPYTRGEQFCTQCYINGEKEHAFKKIQLRKEQLMWKSTILNKHLSAELQVKSCLAFLTTTDGHLTAHAVQRILLRVNNSVLLWCVWFIASAQANWTENAQLLRNNHSMGNSMTKTWPCTLPLELLVEQKLEGVFFFF